VAALTVVGGVVVPAALAATAPEEVTVAPAEAANVVRVVQWNVHQAVDDDGRLDPVAIADALAAQGPIDVLVLHEVARGWPLSGQVDLVTWLSRRLELPYVWGGAASRQFGNAVLTRLPIVASELAELPVADGAQRRSALRVTLVRGAGSPAVDVVATHLQHRNDRESVAARAAEVALLVERYAGLDALVLAGDLNPRQGDPPAYPERRPDRFVEVRALLDAGLTTAADLSACASPTSGRNCSDYVLVGGSLVERSVLVVDGGAFDHRMTVADVVDR
jgi:endonuclease/exonuclease/phosphatase family metal-dependent hydrolase